MRTLIWLLCLIPMALPCHASAPRIRSVMFPFASELPSNEITDIFQDSTGFIWLGTSNGLGRYDGHNVQTVLSDYRCPDRSTVVYNQLYRDHNNTLWICSPNGLLRHDKAGNRLVRCYPSIGLHNNPYCLFQDKWTVLTLPCDHYISRLSNINTINHEYYI